jgi:hypothetical protein
MSFEILKLSYMQKKLLITITYINQIEKFFILKTRKVSQKFLIRSFQ